MCGIFGYIGQKNNAAHLVLDGLKKLEYRGYDSWGIAVAVDNKLVVKKKAGKISGAKINHLPASNFGLGHTRWATHGGVTDINAHPHLDCSGKIAIIHNGIIENYDQIKKNLLKSGHKFVSETDSEVAAHSIEEYSKKLPFLEAVRKAFLEFEGLNAIIAMNSQTFEFVAGKTGSPLVVGFGKGENFLASDAPALLSHTRRVHFLEDGEVVKVTKDKVVLFDGKTGKIKRPKIQTLDWKIEAVEKGKYSHFMLKEMNEQPQILLDIAANGAERVQKLAAYIKKSYGSYMVACGTASYACIAGSYLFSKISHRHINWAVGSEFGYQLDFLTPKSLVIALSQSGETIDTIEAVKKAKAKKVKIFALVNVLGSTLYREADYKLLIGAGVEKAVASTKAFSGKLAHLTMLAYAIAGRIQEGQSVVIQAAKASQKVLGDESVNKIRRLAKKIRDKKHIYVIGRGLSYPASLETALKIKEISYVHAEGFAAGELKHGVIALVEEGTPCIAFLPNDETYGANLAGAMEMKARGGYIIGISHKPHEVFDYYIPVEDAKEATIIPNVIVGQLLAYYLTLERHYDPDKPRNLAKSVTVK